MRLLVVGGSDAGIAAGLRARHVDPEADVTVLVADAYPNFSICGIPYYVSGDVADWWSLAHRSNDDLAAAGLDVRLDTTAIRIHPTRREVTVRDAAGRQAIEPYDDRCGQFVACAGAVSLG